MPATTETPGHIPVSEWPNLEALAVGYDEHLMSACGRLTGQTLTLVFPKAPRVAHRFLNDHTLEWEVLSTNQRGHAEYQAFEVRPNIFFVDLYKPDYEEQVTLVLNQTTGQAVVALSGFHTVNGTKRTYTTFSDAALDGMDGARPFELTEDLIGKHILYRYTSRDAYEHVYLNQGTFTWHCLTGTEKGLADTEPCKMLKLREKLYLLFWSEKVMPVESVVVVDLEQMRSTGRFFCWDPKPAKLVQMRFGSYATVLAETDATRVVQSKTSHL
ncbi:molybdenum cofactor biosynthesis F family protein [Aspergillus fijiensis CBS 313.89]|uniref:Molybdenum cofactor biosynthesis protein F n=1 Tax=Aspergillus fijiensis CBS 313.89 TaxID=1448319 RepID=A0A8G1RCZ0_9EURO|nr:uncharacterized protein BO72DRAFT_441941 [Aspergillus fijiensis CBS 313.89]RAK71467.1 hypothetical protein BO72DRAFT_441941 [Aspergillus fijiensis CBS 313.89]